MKTVITIVTLCIPLLSIGQMDTIECRNRAMLLHILDGGKIALTLDGDTILNEPYTHEQATFDKWVTKFYTVGAPEYIISLPKMKTRGENKNKPYVYAVVVQRKDGKTGKIYKIE